MSIAGPYEYRNIYDAEKKNGFRKTLYLILLYYLTRMYILDNILDNKLDIVSVTYSWGDKGAASAPGGNIFLHL